MRKEHSRMDTYYMTRLEAAAYLRISARTLDRLVAEGKLLSGRVSARRILFRQQDLDDYMHTLFQDAAR